MFLNRPETPATGRDAASLSAAPLGGAVAIASSGQPPTPSLDLEPSGVQDSVQSEPAIDHLSEEAIDPASDNPETAPANELVGFLEADSTMAWAYRARMAALGPDTRSILLLEQRRWLVARDSACMYPSISRGFGDLRDSDIIACFNTWSTARAVVLREGQF